MSLNMIRKEIRDDQLFVFWRGRLIYKRWLARGTEVLIDIYGPPIWLADKSAAGDDSTAPTKR